jgi:decaprenylphospho-beta-D-erythro-pentofuranosid-2-ulose 2-reductase
VIALKNSLGDFQTVLVLGGDSDIAAATLSGLIRKRVRTIILAGRDPERLEARKNDLVELGAPNVEIVQFDGTDLDSHETFVQSTFDQFGDIDLVFLAYGVLGEQMADETDRQRTLNVIQTNYVGPVSVLIPVADALKRQGHGTIVVMSTVAAEKPRRSNFIYGSSKAGLDWFAHGLGDALHGSGVRVMIVRPGFVRSKMTGHLKEAPLAATPVDVAEAILDGLKKNARIVWVPGKMRWVMSILRHLPHGIFRRLNL